MKVYLNWYGQRYEAAEVELWRLRPNGARFCTVKLASHTGGAASFVDVPLELIEVDVN